MRNGTTLLETLIALAVAALLFMTVLRLMQSTVEATTYSIQFSHKLSQELRIVSSYDQNRISSSNHIQELTFKTVSTNSWGTSYVSPLGYQGVLLP